MEKKYIVRLTDSERETLRGVVKKLKGSSCKVRRAQILLKADADGPAWTDRQIAKVFAFRLGPAPKGVANWSLRLVAEKVVELGIVESVSHESVRRTLKKTA